MLAGKYLNSGRHGWLAIIYFAILVYLSGCSSTNVLAPVSDSLHQGYHQVNHGETLYSIAFRYGLDYRTIAKLNHLSSSYKIHPGQKLRLASITSPKITSHSGKKRASTARKLIKPTQVTKLAMTTRTVSHSSSPKAYHTLVWHWPTRGAIISGFLPSAAGNKGIDIAGQYSQPIYAAAGGLVVYCGKGLRGYGQLIIIKHNDEYLSAYAHNSQLLVKEGSFIKAGQQIAKMGNSDSNRIKLHFEIRRAGKPINPLNYLPKN
jgi:lipoprotein NlpD